MPSFLKELEGLPPQKLVELFQRIRAEDFDIEDFQTIVHTHSDMSSPRDAPKSPKSSPKSPKSPKPSPKSPKPSPKIDHQSEMVGPPMANGYSHPLTFGNQPPRWVHPNEDGYSKYPHERPIPPWNGMPILQGLPHPNPYMHGPRYSQPVPQEPGSKTEWRDNERHIEKIVTLSPRDYIPQRKERIVEHGMYGYPYSHPPQEPESMTEWRNNERHMEKTVTSSPKRKEKIMEPGIRINDDHNDNHHPYPEMSIAPQIHISNLTPEIFSGEEQSVSNWIRRFENIAESNGWNEERKIRQLPNFLRGSAETWWNTNRMNIHSFSDIKRLMMRTFMRSKNMHEIRDRLISRRQAPKELITTYMFDILKLCHEFDPDMDEKTKVRYLVDGTKQPIRHDLVLSKPISVDQYLTMARDFELEEENMAKESKPLSQIKSNNVDLTQQILLVQQEGTKLDGIFEDFLKKIIVALQQQKLIPTPQERKTVPQWTQPQPTSQVQSHPQQGIRKPFVMPWTEDGKPICLNCKQEGHMIAKCPIPLTERYRNHPIQKIREETLKKRIEEEEKTFPKSEVHAIDACDVNYPGIVHIGGSLYKRPIDIAIDSGSAITIINQWAFNQIPNKIQIPWEQRRMIAANGSELAVQGCYALEIEISNQIFKCNALLVSKFNGPLLIGNDFLKRNKAVIDYQGMTLSLNGTLTEIRLQSLTTRILLIADHDTSIPAHSECLLWTKKDVSGVELHLHHTSLVEKSSIEMEQLNLTVGRLIVENSLPRIPVRIINYSSERTHIVKGSPIAMMEDLTEDMSCIVDSALPPISDKEFLGMINLSHLQDLPDDELQTIKEFLLRNRDCFARDPKAPGRVKSIQHRIETGDSKPINTSPFRISPKEDNIIKQEIETMLQNRIIRPSKSPWASPVVIVKKKDGSLRFCVDYRKLNTVTERDVYPLPRIDDTLDLLGGARYFTTLDCASGYWQIEVHEDHRHKTAFVSKQGLYEFEVLPFGLNNAPATFQ